jgi:hypothetical protein
MAHATCDSFVRRGHQPCGGSEVTFRAGTIAGSQLINGNSIGQAERSW